MTPQNFPFRWLVHALLALALSACSKVSPESSRSDPAAGDKPSATPSAGSDVKNRAVAVLAGGCFWGMEEILRQAPGVLETQVGYAGGSVPNPDYDAVSSGRSGHAEAVRIVYDQSVLSYRALLSDWFFRMHDPTTKNRQGNDVGTQYRSVIFVTNSSERQIAESVIRELDQSGKLDSPIVTTIEAAGTFTSAEDYHQDYLQKNPGGYSCHYLREWT